MKTAIEKLDDTELNGRRIRLVEDTRRNGRRGRSRSSTTSRSRSRSRRRSRYLNLFYVLNKIILILIDFIDHVQDDHHADQEKVVQSQSLAEVVRNPLLKRRVVHVHVILKSLALEVVIQHEVQARIQINQIVTETEVAVIFQTKENPAHGKMQNDN